MYKCNIFVNHTHNAPHLYRFVRNDSCENKKPQHPYNIGIGVFSHPSIWIIRISGYYSKTVPPEDFTQSQFSFLQRVVPVCMWPREALSHVSPSLKGTLQTVCLFSQYFSSLLPTKTPVNPKRYSWNSCAI